MNKLKRGMADMEHDYDTIILTIKRLLDSKLEGFNPLEISIISYNIVYFIQNEEFSLRDYALHFLKTILISFKQNL